MLDSSQELSGKVLGGCTLERLLGQGGMEQYIWHYRIVHRDMLL